MITQREMLQLAFWGADSRQDDYAALLEHIKYGKMEATAAEERKYREGYEYYGSRVKELDRMIKEIDRKGVQYDL